MLDIHVLKAMRALDNPKLFTNEEIRKNAETAHYAALASAALADDDHWLDKYFEVTGEDKQLYINEVERLK